MLAEGPLDALACRWLHSGTEYFAAADTSFMHNWRPERTDGRRVIVEADSDAQGYAAACALQNALEAMGRAVEVKLQPPGCKERENDNRSEQRLDL